MISMTHLFCREIVKVIITGLIDTWLLNQTYSYSTNHRPHTPNLMLKQLLSGISWRELGKKISLIIKILTMSQQLRHHNTIFSPAGNLAAAVVNTRGLLRGGRDNSIHLLRMGRLVPVQRDHTQEDLVILSWRAHFQL